jgi:hypothetical protein
LHNCWKKSISFNIRTRPGTLRVANTKTVTDTIVMPSILEAQIDYLGEQVGALPPAERDARQIDDAVSVALSLFDRIRTTAAQLGPQASVSLVSHWLRSAEAILPSIRQNKRHGHRPVQLNQFMRAILEARAFLTADDPPGSREGARSLDEVERELQSRAE